MQRGSSFNYGSVGIENKDGSDGVQIVYGQKFINDEMAIIFNPAEKQVVPAGESKEITFALDAARLNNGSYDGNIKLQNNTPTNSEVNIPVKLNVIGSPELKTPESIEFGEVMSYKENDVQNVYQNTFAISNSGTDDLAITSISLASGQELIAEYKYRAWNGTSWKEIPTSFPSTKPFELATGASDSLRIKLAATGDLPVINDTLIFVGNMNEEYRLPINGTVILSPQISLSTELENIMANNAEYTEKKQYTIDNSNGLGSLLYNISLDFIREKGVEEAETAAVYNTSNAELIAVSNYTPETQSEDSETYNKVLEYENSTEAKSLLGFGPNSPFSCAVGYTAPKEGFNLTHFKTWYAHENWSKTKVQVEIRVGANITDAKVLYKEDFEYVEESPDGTGKYITFELSENQKFYPNEKFYIIITYPLGVGFPQGIASQEATVPGRFFFPSGGVWYDLAYANGFTLSGWMDG